VQAQRLPSLDGHTIPFLLYNRQGLIAFPVESSSNRLLSSTRHIKEKENACVITCLNVFFLSFSRVEDKEKTDEDSKDNCVLVSHIKERWLIIEQNCLCIRLSEWCPSIRKPRSCVRHELTH